ncbi:hypothetical protein D3C71_1874450 [compost metagenome]
MPLRVGLLSSVVSPFDSGPVLPPTSSITSRPVTWPGGCVSTEKFQMPVASLVWPSALVAVAVMSCGPSASGTSGVKCQVPVGSVTVSPR